jgi:hypothetical protein
VAEPPILVYLIKIKWCFGEVKWLGGFRHKVAEEGLGRPFS